MFFSQTHFEHSIVVPHDQILFTQRLAYLYREFIHISYHCTCIIIDEMNVSHDVERQIPPIQSQMGLAGGLKFMKCGIFFKFAR